MAPNGKLLPVVFAGGVKRGDAHEMSRHLGGDAHEMSRHLGRCFPNLLTLDLGGLDCAKASLGA